MKSERPSFQLERHFLCSSELLNLAKSDKLSTYCLLKLSINNIEGASFGTLGVMTRRCFKDNTILNILVMDGEIEDVLQSVAHI